MAVDWINKLGSFPTKMEKVISKKTWEEKIEEKKRLNNDFKEFVNKYLNDSVFRKKFSEG